MAATKVSTKAGVREGLAMGHSFHLLIRSRGVMVAESLNAQLEQRGSVAPRSEIGPFSWNRRSDERT